MRPGSTPVLLIPLAAMLALGCDDPATASWIPPTSDPVEVGPVEVASDPRPGIVTPSLPPTAGAPPATLPMPTVSLTAPAPAAAAAAPPAPAPSAAPAAAAAPVASTAAAAAPASPAAASASNGPRDPKAGQALYTQYCASCHGSRGGGDGPAAMALSPKPVRHDDGGYMNALSNQHLFKVVKEGGPAVGKSPMMAAWASAMSDEQIWDVVAFVRTLAVPPYTGPQP